MNLKARKEALEAALDIAEHGVKKFGIGRKLRAPRRIFRIEFPNGHGPYNSGRPDAMHIYMRLCDFDAPDGWDCARQARLNREQCGVSDQAFYRAHGDASYAFNDRAALNAWFPLAAQRYLARLGAKLIEYEVSAGDYLCETGASGEVLFNRPHARVIATHPLGKAR